MECNSKNTFLWVSPTEECSSVSEQNYLGLDPAAPLGGTVKLKGMGEKSLPNPLRIQDQKKPPKKVQDKNS